MGGCKRDSAFRFSRSVFHLISQTNEVRLCSASSIVRILFLCLPDFPCDSIITCQTFRLCSGSGQAEMGVLTEPRKTSSGGYGDFRRVAKETHGSSVLQVESECSIGIAMSLPFSILLILHHLNRTTPYQCLPLSTNPSASQLAINSAIFFLFQPSCTAIISIACLPSKYFKHRFHAFWPSTPWVFRICMDIAANHLDVTPDACLGFWISEGDGAGFDGSWDVRRKGMVVCVLVVLEVGDDG